MTCYGLAHSSSLPPTVERRGTLASQPGGRMLAGLKA